MKLQKIITTTVLATIAGVFTVCNANASISVGYNVGGDITTVGGDAVTLFANSGSLNLDEGIAQQAKLNNVTWVTTGLAPSGSYDTTLNRQLSISFTAGSQTLSQDVNVTINRNIWTGTDKQMLTIETSSPVDFSWTDGGVDYFLTVMALKEELSTDFGWANIVCGQIDGEFLLTTKNNPNVGTSVPEPSTVIAGALLLVPFGISTVRILRKPRSA